MNKISRSSGFADTPSKQRNTADWRDDGLESEEVSKGVNREVDHDETDEREQEEREEVR